MKSWEDVLVAPATTLRDALVSIDRSGCQMALVVDAQRRLLGTLSDGDARRALLKGLSLADPVAAAMHENPTVARLGEDRHSILLMMRQRGLHQIPIVDAQGIVVGLEVVDDFLTAPKRDNWIVIMAGGLGSRLQELTRDTPKPMLTVGSRPLLETIVRSLVAQGFHRFYFAVNYKSEQIESHFGDGAALGAEIRYLREERRLGTAGALSLLPHAPEAPVVVTNADLLTKEDFGAMVDQHVEHRADATMAVRDYQMQVPFGVVSVEDGRIAAIEEKPVRHFVVSAGIYVLSTPALGLVPAGAFFDMPSLFEAAVAQGLRTRCHHVNGYWLDIGRLSDYERANLEFSEVFPVIGGQSVLAVVAARGGSKGVPGKNIAPVGGRPLIAWTIAAARQSRFVDRLVLSSDDAAIIAAAREAGCEAPFCREAALATDEASSIDVVVDALQRIAGHDIVVLLQPTSPLRRAEDIDGALELLRSSGAPSCVSLRPAEDHPYWTFRRAGSGALARFVELPAGMPLRRQELPDAWALNGAVYAARVDWFLRERTFLGSDTVGYVMPAQRSLDIDTPADLDAADRLLREERSHA